jgi:hypothetical protein
MKSTTNKLFCDECQNGDLLAPMRPYYVIDSCDLYNTPECISAKLQRDR